MNFIDMISATLEMQRATEALERAAAERDIARALCLMEYLGKTDEITETTEDMIGGPVYPDLTRENVMARARIIAGTEAASRIDFEKREVWVVTFGSEDGWKQVIGADRPKLQEMFFSHAATMGMDSNAKIDARVNRVRESPLHTEGHIPLEQLLRMDVKNEQAGEPLCPGCKIHHKAKDGARKGVLH